VSPDAQPADLARTWPAVLSTLLAGRDLTRDDTAWAMDQVMSGEASPVPLAGFLVALRAKGETVDELHGLVDAMLDHAVRIEVDGPCVDVVGTGGDRRNTVNISTMAALVVAGAGARVVKHGNRAASSSTGSADVLEALGVDLDLPVELVAAVAERVGITFCFAQRFHPAMRHAAVARRELAVATAFNFLGPLTNPAQPVASAIGVADPRMAPVMAGVLAARGRSALVFRGDDGLDELTTTGPSRVWWVRQGSVTEHELDPAHLGLAPASLDDLVGGDSAYNAAVVRDVLDGARGPVRDAVVLNAAAGLVALDEATGDGTGALEDRFAAALERAEASVDSGSAARVLTDWAAATRARD
jgi:anthranilate phosphoribosyltransferase